MMASHFHGVLDSWIYGVPYFTELFLTRSSARPRLLFAVEQRNRLSFYSSPQRRNPYKKPLSSLVVSAEFHTKFPPDNMQMYPRTDRQFACGYASGLIYFFALLSKKDDNYGVPAVCNPNTGLYATLPYLQRYKEDYNFFGFDPIDKQFKVLFMAYHPRCSEWRDHRIMTLDTGRRRLWRKIKCPLTHEPWSQGICINGVLYYIGKLGVYHWEDRVDENAIVFSVRVLEDFEKPEWSKPEYTLRDDKIFFDECSNVSIRVVGMSDAGEIFFSMCYYTSKQPFYVFYFNPETKTHHSVEIKGFGDDSEELGKRFVYTFANHVEDLNVNDAKLLRSSIYAPYVKTKEEEENSEGGGEEVRRRTRRRRRRRRN
ncbi:unnamed protein product [Microthlaspi erraticum]|uniref:F-box associated beta-propeller type 3 domain-containing protein n=1 Tax=Microthlaspi erraticum TaxID=1685480 RepID=A0A6D2KFB4_9BRAS|nr:unnamed protein product [Microthlaspi erraticum]